MRYDARVLNSPLCRLTFPVVAVVLLTGQVALGQAPAAADPPEPAEATAAPGVTPDSGTAAASDGKADSAPAATAPQDLATDADADSDDDTFDEEPYRAPMVESDYRNELTGYIHEPHHNHRWFFHNLTALRVNPLGLTNRFRTGYRMQLSHRPEKIFEESFASVGLDTEITPAFGYAGARLEVQPAVLFNFWASYGVLGSFGSFSYTRSFETAQADYSDSELDDTEDQDYSVVGQRATISALFQFGAGGVVMRNNVKGHWRSMDLHDNDRVFYDASLDVLFPNSGWVITNDADLLILTEFNLKLGLRYTATAALYKADQLVDGENPNTPHHRLGPAFIYEFFDDPPGPNWNKPTLVVLAQWWLKHRYRTTKAPVLPYLVIGFVQQGDLLISAKK